MPKKNDHKHRTSPASKNAPTRAPAPSHRLAFGVLGLAVAAAGSAGWYYLREANAARAAAMAFDQATHASDATQTAVNDVVTCMTMVDRPVARTASDFQKQLATGSDGQYSKLGPRITSQCTPAFRSALDAVKPSFMNTPSLSAGWKNFEETARAFVDEANKYAASTAPHAPEDDTDHAIVAAAQKWSSGSEDDPDALRFESFLACAVPSASMRADQNAFAQWMARQCDEAKAPAYMDRIRSECAPKLTTGGMLPSDDHVALATVRHFRVLKDKMSVAELMFAGCTNHVRRQWIAADAGPLVQSAGHLFAQMENLAAAVAKLKPAEPKP